LLRGDDQFLFCNYLAHVLWFLQNLFGGPTPVNQNGRLMTLTEELQPDRKANLRYADLQGREYSAKGLKSRSCWKTRTDWSGLKDRLSSSHFDFRRIKRAVLLLDILDSRYSAQKIFLKRVRKLISLARIQLAEPWCATL
jgi:hypothetical protein